MASGGNKPSGSRKNKIYNQMWIVKIHSLDTVMHQRPLTTDGNSSLWLIGKICLIYLDDVVVFRSTGDGLLQWLYIVF